MHNRVGFNRLSRKSSHRKALHKNMVTSLFKHERIKTTKAKAKEIRRTAEKLVTRAKVDSVHNRRIVAKLITDKQILNKLFTEISPRFQERPGGYTRILKLGYRQGDAAEMVILELVEDEVKSSKKKAAPKKKKAAAKTPVKAKDEPKKEEATEVEAKDAPVEEKPAADEVEKSDAPVEEKAEVAETEEKAEEKSE